MSQPTQRKTRDPGAIGYDQIAHLPFDNIATLAASQATTTVQGRMPLAVSSKIMAAEVSYSASTGGGVLFNIAVGNGTYEGATTAGVEGRGTFTITGSPLTGQNNTYTINGIIIACPQTTGNSVTQQAAADVAVLNAATVAGAFAATTTPAGYAFSNVAGVITYTANAYGTAYNLTPTANAGAGGDAIAVVASTGGVVINAVPSIALPDGFWLTGAHNFAAAGNAVFPTDQPIMPGAPDVGQFFPVPLDQFDVLYKQNQQLTLRAYSLGSTTLTNLKVVLLLKPFDVIATHPSNRVVFQPALHIR
jgi:hypothetical protein